MESNISNNIKITASVNPEDIAIQQTMPRLNSFLLI